MHEYSENQMPAKNGTFYSICLQFYIMMCIMMCIYIDSINYYYDDVKRRGVYIVRRCDHRI